jgi:hypothetical protein
VCPFSCRYIFCFSLSLSLKGAELVAALRFSGFPRRSDTPEHLKGILRDRFTDAQRRRFLSFVTASTVLPGLGATGGGEGGGNTTSGKINIAFVPWGNERLPLAHTCFDRLDLPDYQDAELLHTKLTWCLDNLEMAGFGEA